MLAQRDLIENHGRPVSRCYLQDIAQDVALICQSKEERWEYVDPPFPEEVKTVSVGLDGTCMLYCEEGWRQAMVGTILLYDRSGERLYTVYVGAPPQYCKEEFYQHLEREVKRYQQRYPQAIWLGVADGAHGKREWLVQWPRSRFWIFGMPRDTWKKRLLESAHAGSGEIGSSKLASN